MANLAPAACGDFKMVKEHEKWGVEEWKIGMNVLEKRRSPHQTVIKV